MKSLIVYILICGNLFMVASCGAANRSDVHMAEKSGVENVYKIETTECLLSISTFDEASLNENIIKFYRKCDLPLKVQASMFGKLLDAALEQEHDLTRLKKLAWGKLENSEILIPLIIYSSTSKSWQEIQLNPSYKKHSQFIINYLDDKQVFSEFQAVLKARGFEMSLVVAEKILVGKLNEAKRFIDPKVYSTLEKGEIDERVPYSVVLWFELTRS